MYALLLIRSAAAAGATQVFIEPSGAGDSVEFRWDGRGFTRDELEQPFACLFEPPDPGCTSRRELAAAVLGLLRLEPRWVTVSSGGGGGRSRLHIRDLRSRKVEPDRSARAETVIQASGAGLWDSDLESLLRERCAMSDVAVYVRGKRLPLAAAPAEGEDAASFEEDGVRGWVGVPVPGENGSRLDLFSYGVLAAPIDADLGPVRVRGALNDDLLPLNLSRTNVLRGERLDAALCAVRRAAWELVGEACRTQSWRGEEAFSVPEQSDRERLDWLRECAASLLGGGGEGAESALEELRQAPLFEGADGACLTLEALETRLRSEGTLRVCDGAWSGEGAAPVRLRRPEERGWLTRIFGDVLETVLPARAEEEEPGDGGEPGKPLREALRAIGVPAGSGLSLGLISRIRSGSGPGDSVVFKDEEGGEEVWVLDESHPLVREAAGLEAGGRNLFPLSVLITGLTRALGDAGSLDEAALLRALALSAAKERR